MPKDAKLLSVQMQGNTPILWAVCDNEVTHQDRDIVMYMTGEEMEKGALEYIGTVENKGFVMHFFEKVVLGL